MSTSADTPTDEPRYTAALDWLLGRINFERTAVVPYGERQFKLDRMRQLLTRLGNPDAGMKIVHVAGTKGKGSTSAMIASMLRSAGYSTGVYSSPHLHRLEERLAVDGVPCPADEFVALIDRVRPIAEQMDDGPTYFELTTAIALVHFADRQVDAVVLEVGLGGRLDSTNVCLPVVSVITSISLDHTKQLGNTLSAIAGEKAGIIKPGVPVISGVTDDSPREVIAKTAREHGCRLAEIGRDFQVKYRSPSRDRETPNAASLFGQIDFQCNDSQCDVGGQLFELSNAKLALLGQHQAANAATALATVVELRHQGWSISPEAMREGLANTRLPARIEIVPGSPTTIIDTAHNGASASALAQTIEECFPRRFPKCFSNRGTSNRGAARWLILSISRDKDAQEIVANLAPSFDHFVATQYQENPRAIPAGKLADIIRNYLGEKQSSATIETIPHPDDAWKFAKDAAKEGELVTIAGSFFIAAELRGMVLEQALARRGGTSVV